MMDEPITRKSQECCPFFLSYFSENSILRWKKDRKKGVEIGGVVLLKRRSLTPSHSVQSSLSRVSHTMTHTHTKKNWKQVFLLLYYIHTRNSIHNFIFSFMRGLCRFSQKFFNDRWDAWKRNWIVWNCVKRRHKEQNVGRRTFLFSSTGNWSGAACGCSSQCNPPANNTLCGMAGGLVRERERERGEFKKQRVCRCFRESHWFQKIKKRNREIKIESKKRAREPWLRVRISWSACSTINYLRPRVYFEGALETIENTSSSAFFPGTTRFSFCRLCRVPPLVNCASLSRFLFFYYKQEIIISYCVILFINFSIRKSANFQIAMRYSQTKHGVDTHRRKTKVIVDQQTINREEKSVGFVAGGKHHTHTARASPWPCVARVFLPGVPYPLLLNKWQVALGTGWVLSAS